MSEANEVLARLETLGATCFQAVPGAGGNARQWLMVIVGPNGSGKSTLAARLCALLNARLSVAVPPIQYIDSSEYVIDRVARLASQIEPFDSLENHKADLRKNKRICRRLMEEMGNICAEIDPGWTRCWLDAPIVTGMRRAPELSVFVQADMRLNYLVECEGQPGPNELYEGDAFARWGRAACDDHRHVRLCTHDEEQVKALADQLAADCARLGIGL